MFLSKHSVPILQLVPSLITYRRENCLAIRRSTKKNPLRRRGFPNDQGSVYYTEMMAPFTPFGKNAPKLVPGFALLYTIDSTWLGVRTIARALESTVK